MQIRDIKHFSKITKGQQTKIKMDVSSKSSVYRQTYETMLQATTRYHSLADWHKFLKCIITNAVSIFQKHKHLFYRWVLQTHGTCLKGNLIISSKFEVHLCLWPKHPTQNCTLRIHIDNYILKMYMPYLQSYKTRNSPNELWSGHNKIYSAIIYYRTGWADTGERCIFGVLWEANVKNHLWGPQVD